MSFSSWFWHLFRELLQTAGGYGRFFHPVILLLENSYHLDPLLQGFDNPKLYVTTRVEPRSLQPLYNLPKKTPFFSYGLESTRPQKKSRSQEISCWKITLTETNISPMKIPMFPCKFHQKRWIFHGELLVLGRVFGWLSYPQSSGSVDRSRKTLW